MVHFPISAYVDSGLIQRVYIWEMLHARVFSKRLLFHSSLVVTAMVMLTANLPALSHSGDSLRAWSLRRLSRSVSVRGFPGRLS